MFLQLRSIQPSNPTYHLGVAGFNARMGRFAEAEEALATVIDMNPRDPRGYRALAVMYLNSNTAPREARRAAEMAARLEPIPSNFHMLSVACQRSGDAAAALAAIEQAMKLDPGNPEYRRLRDMLQGN